MTNNFDTNFFKLAELHAIAAAKLQSLKIRKTQEKEGREIIRAIAAEEARLRTLIFRYPPTSNQEAQTKLLYVVDFIGSTKNNLSKDELSTIMESVAHLL